MKDTLTFLAELAAWHKRCGADIASQHLTDAGDYIRETLSSSHGDQQEKVEKTP